MGPAEGTALVRIQSIRAVFVWEVYSPPEYIRNQVYNSSADQLCQFFPASPKASLAPRALVPRVSPGSSQLANLAYEQ